MKILWVKAGKLLPVDTGGKIRSYNILRFLAKEHSVTLLSYYGGRRDLDYEARIDTELPGTVTIYTAAPDATFLDKVCDYLRHLPKTSPHAVSKFTHPIVKQRLSAWLNEGSFDVAVCDFLSASLNFPDKAKTPAVLFQHNVESSLWYRLAATELSPIKKLSFRIEASKMARYEPSALRKFRRVIAVSEPDRQQMLAMSLDSDITVVPTGVDSQKFRAIMPSTIKQTRVVFIGSMDWEPNIDAVQYFCEQIWPRVLADNPGAIFQIVGRNPHQKVQRLNAASVKVTGTVSSVADYLRDATVVVVPLRIGGGTRLKIFEAMAMGKAVISTTIGAEGLDVENGRHLVLADDPGAFANAILLLLRDTNLRRQYEQAAAELAAQYDWSCIARKFANALSMAQGISTAGQAANIAATVIA